MTHYLSRILIVEDEEILAQNLRDFLSRRGAEVRIALSAEAALDEVRRFRPDYVVLDYDLPGIDGLEAFARLKEHFPSLRGALISGRPTEQFRDGTAATGIERVLTKPFSLAELERVLLASHSDGAAGPGDDGRAAAEPRRAERRSNRMVPHFPLDTTDGSILKDRRLGERRMRENGLLAGSLPA